MRIPFRLVDAFAAAPFGGNPAPVFVLPDARDAAWCQAVAAEMNASNTAFVVAPAQDGDGSWGLRWFTPKVEVPLCGHGTLATAHVLWEDGHELPETPIRFQTLSGALTAFRRPARRIARSVPTGDRSSASASFACTSSRHAVAC